MNVINPEQDAAIQNALDALRPAPSRDPQAAAQGREHYMQQARTMRAQRVARPAPRRVPGWAVLLKPATAIIMALILLLVSSAAGVYAAQGSLPNQPSYALKLAGEDIHLALTLNDVDKINLLEQLAQNRIQEMLALGDLGLAAPDETVQRFNLHLEQALRLAAGLEDEELRKVMSEVHTRTEAQIQNMDNAALNGYVPMEQIRQRLQEHMRLAELGLEDPLQFRQQLQQRTQQQRQPDPSRTPSPQGTASQQGKDPEHTPGPAQNQGSGQPAHTQTPTPQGSGNSQQGDNGQQGENGQDGNGQHGNGQDGNGQEGNGQEGRDGGKGQGGPPTSTPTPDDLANDDSTNHNSGIRDTNSKDKGDNRR